MLGVGARRDATQSGGNIYRLVSGEAGAGAVGQYIVPLWRARIKTGTEPDRPCGAKRTKVRRLDEHARHQGRRRVVGDEGTRQPAHP